MEMKVLQALDWKLNGPSSHDFIEYFLDLMPDAHEASFLDFVRSLSKCLVELSVTRYDVVVQHYPSEIAFASIWCAFQYVELIVLPGSQIFVESMPLIQLVSGFDINNARSILLLKVLSCLVEELDSASDGIGDTSQEDEMMSISSESSSRSIMRDV